MTAALELCASASNKVLGKPEGFIYSLPLLAGLRLAHKPKDGQTKASGWLRKRALHADSLSHARDHHGDSPARSHTMISHSMDIMHGAKLGSKMECCFSHAQERLRVHL